ncbi:putative signal transduction protein with CBS domains [Methanosalsum zhilinae DSM 4017]|uniref:Putative signal transduction protein with CBS domains n=1 Tax=Methanosalsum zhilinae (strain DSM 4017 / NBRC 107636 / OCM 62 / WeN5) TaxID=679901 RepID=F7XL61_METZD|nr:putative signal transduction protein with CBS domains [Methanosalsum zhilinae DSM 4017]
MKIIQGLKNVPKSTIIQDIMVKDVAYATLPGSRDEVLNILKDKKISGVPILKGGKVTGVVSRTDLLKNPEEEQIAMLMTRDPVTVSPDANIVDAAKLLLENNIRRLPVVTDGNLAGMVTIADIIASIADLDITEQIGPYLDDGVVAVWSETPLPLVARIMELSHKKAVPILDSDLELVGIISELDVINASIIEDSVEMSDMSAGSDDDEWTWESMRDTMSIYYSVSRIKVPDIVVKDIMIKEPITASYISEVSDCALKMKRARIDQMPVVNANQKLLGILKDRDLLKVLVKH